METDVLVLVVEVDVGGIVVIVVIDGDESSGEGGEAGIMW